jgi:hypothetical protein
MKKSIIVTAVCCLVFGAFVIGQQNTPKQKTIEPCCCKHTQQIAEDLHWIREQLSKPYMPPELPQIIDPGNPKNPPQLKVPEFNFPPLDPPHYRTPKKPKN